MSFVVAESPLRISLFGGGSDRPEFYEEHGPGEVLACAINKYMRVAINKVDNDLIKLMYSKIEIVDDIEKLQHDIVRNVWKHWEFPMGYEIASFADLPTVGTGLGSSSAFTCALVAALGLEYRPQEIAEVACSIEIDLCKSPIGKQDQYVSAYGNSRSIVFNSKSSNLTPLTTASYNPNVDMSWAMLFFTGTRRNTNDILSQHRMSKENVEILKKLRDQVSIAEDMFYEAFAHAFGSSDYLTNIGKLLHESWKLKRMLPGSTNPDIDAIYLKARRAGALGGKILGAGGGGFMLLWANPDNHLQIRDTLYPLVHTPFEISKTGTRLLTNV
jgi:D-glycero-alpha-D-manno-heptose-7-phosphate kinase